MDAQTLWARFPVFRPATLDGAIAAVGDPETGAYGAYDDDGLLCLVLDRDGANVPQPHVERKAYCYFIGGDEGPVKIGHSLDVRRRLSAIQMCSPVPLRVLALIEGGEPQEKRYHHQFRRYRLHGEWFKREGFVMTEIDRLQRLARTFQNRRA